MKTFIKMTGLVAMIAFVFTSISVEAKQPQHMQWNSGTIQLQQKLVDDGRSIENAKSIITVCKQIEHDANQKDGQDRNARRCVAMMAGAGTAESSQCRTQPRGSNNCFGIMKNGKVVRFESVGAGMYQRAMKRGKFWWKHDSAEDIIHKSKYCVSEESSGAVGDCPNRRKTVNRVIAYIGNI